MPSPVPAIDRAAKILKFLAMNPQAAFTLSEIARDADAHKATCASALAALEAHGMVHRDSALRYCLGSASLTLAESFRERFPAFLAVRPEICRLAVDTGLSVAAIARDGEDLLVLDVIGDSHPAHLSLRIGMRVPLEPPIGTIFKAWASRNEIDTWVKMLVTHYGGDRDRYLTAITALRARGYSLGGEHDLNVELETALHRINQQDGDARALEVALIVAGKLRNFRHGDAADPDEPVNSLIGPIFGITGDVVMTVNVYGPLGTIRHRDIDRLVPTLLRSTTRMTRSIGGRLPAMWTHEEA